MPRTLNEIEADVIEYSYLLGEYNTELDDLLEQKEELNRRVKRITDINIAIEDSLIALEIELNEIERGSKL